MREEVAGDGIGASGPDSWVCLELWSSWGGGAAVITEVPGREQKKTGN